MSGPRSRARKTKYGPKAGKKVGRAMHEMKRGKLKSGRSGRRVKSREQAIAIGLSEARSEGGRVPKKSAKRKTKKGAKKTATRSAKRAPKKRAKKTSKTRKSPTRSRSAKTSKRRSAKSKRASR